MGCVGAHTKEPGGAIAFWGNGTLRQSIDLRQRRVNISIVTRGINFGGEWPKLHVRLDSRIVGSITVDSCMLTEYTLHAEVPNPGTMILEVALVNYVGTPGRPLASRNVLVQNIVARPA